MKLLFTIKNQTLYFRSRSVIVAGSQGYLTAKFTFSDDWGNVDKYAQFKRDDLYYDIGLDENDECVVPWEVLTREGVFNVNVVGLNEEGSPNKFITVNSIDIMVEASGVTEEISPTEPTEGVFGESVRIALRAIDDSKDDALQEIADGTVQALSSTGIWESNEQVKVGDIRYMHGREYAGYVLECVGAGTTGNTQPVVSTEEVDNATDLEYMSGTLPIAHGGTGATSIAGARNALGLGNTTGAVPVANGGTGATTASGARSNIGAYSVNGGRIYGGIEVQKPNINNGYFSIAKNHSATLDYGVNLTDYNAGGESMTVAMCGNDKRFQLQYSGNTYNILSTRDIATQAEAEAGTNNTTVTTPLRVQNAIDKQRPIKTFTNLEQLGLDKQTVTWQTIYSTLPASSKLLFATNAAEAPLLVMPYNGYMRLEIVKISGYGVVYGYYWGTKETHIAYFDESLFSGWKRLATNGALSMPSNTRIAVSLGTSNTTYIAPCDGWAMVTGTMESTAPYVRIVNDSNNMGIHIRRSVNNDYPQAFLPAKKGHSIIFVNKSTENVNAYFIYAQSEV